MIDKAKALCLEAHQGQVDKCGEPYYLHPFAVADMVEDETDKVVAYLHDVVEDTHFTLEDLEEQGFDECVIAAVNAMTRRDGEEYFSYIRRLSQNEIARRVKTADLTHNMDPSRHGATKQMLDRYARALAMLEE